jgi:hypothetical protein
VTITTTGVPGNLLGGGTITTDYVPGPNQSGIGHNKLSRQWPTWIREVDGYRESWSQTEHWAKRMLDVQWGYNKAFIDYMLGYSTTVLKGTTPFLSRKLPHQHPRFPWLYATSCAMVHAMGAITNDPRCTLTNPDGSFVQNEDGSPYIAPMIYYFANDPNNYADGLARYEVTYRPRDYELREDSEIGNPFDELNRYVTRDSVYAISSLPVPSTSGGLKFVGLPAGNNGIPDSIAGQLLLPVTELTYVWHEVPDVPETAIGNCVGRVNDEAFDPPYDLSTGTRATDFSHPTQMVGGTPDASWLDFQGAQGGNISTTFVRPGYGPETLLMQAPEKKRYRTITGRVAWQIVLKFLHKPSGWNYFPRIITAQSLRSAYDWQGSPNAGVAFTLGTLGGNPDGPRIYTKADLNQLFTPVPSRQYQTIYG